MAQERIVTDQKHELVYQLSSLLTPEIRKNYDRFCKRETLPGQWEAEGVSLWLGPKAAQKLQEIFGVKQDNILIGNVRVIAQDEEFIRIIQYTDKGQVGLDIATRDEHNDEWWPEGHRLPVGHAIIYLTSAIVAVGTMQKEGEIK